MNEIVSEVFGCWVFFFNEISSEMLIFSYLETYLFLMILNDAVPILFALQVFFFFLLKYS